MFRVDRFGPTRRLTMARSFFGRSFCHCHAYLVDGLLVDSGCPLALRPFQTFLDDEDVEQAAITHYHEDHAGNVVSLNLSGIPVYAPLQSVKKIVRGTVNQSGRPAPYEIIVWGKSYGGETFPFPERIETEHYNFEVIPSPGHSDDMHIFYERKQGWLFSGDLFIAARRSYWRREEDPRITMETLKKILALDFDALFCGHSPLLKGGKEALKRKLAFLEEMREKAAGLDRQGMTIPQITKQLLGGEGIFTYLTLGDFSRRRLIEGLLAK